MIVSDLAARVNFEFDETAFAKVENALASLGKGFAGIAAIAAGIGAGVAYEIGELADVGAEASRTAQRLGITTQTLQEFQFAAKSSGLEAGAFTHGLQHLALLTYELSQGSSEAAMTVSNLGVQTHDAAGKLKTPDALLEDIAEKFHRMPDGLNKTGLAMKVFGRAGAELIPTLNKGKAGLEELRARARQLGVVMSTDLIKRSKEYKKASVELGQALEGLKIKMLGPLVGAQGWKVAVTGFIVKYGDKIADVFERVVHAVGLAAHLIGNSFKLIGMALKGLWEAPWWAQLGILVGGLGLAFVTLGGEALVAAGATIAAWAVAALPFVAIGLAIGALLLVLDDVYTYLKGGPSVIGDYLIPSFKDFFEKKLPGYVATAWQKIKDFFNDLKTWALDLLADFGKYMEDKIPGLKFLIDHVVSSGDTASALVGGGAASPMAAAGMSSVGGDVTQNVSYAPQITVNAQTGASADDIASHVKGAVQDHWDMQMRQTNAAVGGAR